MTSKALLRKTFDSDYPILSIYIPSDIDEVVKQSYIENIERHNKMFSSDFHCDAGFDLFVPDDVILKSDKLNANTIDFNIKCKMECYYGNCFPHEVIALSYYLYPRSSISKTPLRMSNSVGIIDSGYRGNIMAKVDYISSSDEKETYYIEKNTRLFQICTPDLKPFYVDYTHTPFDEVTSRGSGGFGSTGIKG